MKKDHITVFFVATKNLVSHTEAINLNIYPTTAHVRNFNKLNKTINGGWYLDES